MWLNRVRSLWTTFLMMNRKQNLFAWLAEGLHFEWGNGGWLMLLDASKSARFWRVEECPDLEGGVPFIAKMARVGVVGGFRSLGS